MVKPVVSRLATIEALLIEIQFELAAQAKRLRAVDMRLDAVIDKVAPVRRKNERTLPVGQIRI
jgi:hypothetical protein